MVLNAKIISPDATLNTWKELGGIDFLPGSSVIVALQIIDPDKGIRYVPPSTCTIQFTLNKLDGTQFTLAGAFIDVLDRSLIKVTIPATPALATSDSSPNLASGNILFSLDLLGDGTQVLQGVVLNALRRNDVTQF